MHSNTADNHYFTKYGSLDVLKNVIKCIEDKKSNE